MPLLKHAKKKLRQDKKRTLANKKVKNLYKSLVKKAKETPTAAAISEATSAIDKAAKHHLMHENKAARMKSSLSKLTADSASATKAEAKPKAKKTTKKAAPKKTTKKK